MHLLGIGKSVQVVSAEASMIILFSFNRSIDILVLIG